MTKVLKMGSRKKIAVAMLGLLLGGCFSVHYETNAPGNGGTKRVHENFFFWGLTPTQVVDMKAVCPNGVAQWHSEATFGDGCLSLITLGIYSPRTVFFECSSGGGTWMLQLKGDRVVSVDRVRIDG